MGTLASAKLYYLHTTIALLKSFVAQKRVHYCSECAESDTGGWQCVASNEQN